MASKPGSDFSYSYYLPHKPPIAMCESERVVTCPCGAVFLTRSRVKHRCDPCQSARKAALMAAANERLKAKRKKARQCSTSANSWTD